MSAVSDPWLATGLVHGIAQSTSVLGTTSVITRWSRWSPSQRHTLWTAALVAAPVGFWTPLTPGPALLATWAAGALLACLPLLIGVAGLWRARANEAPHPRVPGAWLSAGPQGPWVWGVPAHIVLPRESLRWPAEHLHGIVAHERAHAARADWLWHVLGWLACATLFAHPLAWWALRQQSQAAELAADELAVRSGTPAASYARALLAAGRGPAHVGGLGAAGRPLVQRIEAILSPPRPFLPRHCASVVAALLVLWPVTMTQAAPAEPPPLSSCEISDSK